MDAGVFAHCLRLSVPFFPTAVEYYFCRQTTTRLCADRPSHPFASSIPLCAYVSEAIKIVSKRKGHLQPVTCVVRRSKILAQNSDFLEILEFMCAGKGVVLPCRIPKTCLQEEEKKGVDKTISDSFSMSCESELKIAALLLGRKEDWPTK